MFSLIILIFFLLILSGLFTCTEVSIFSLNRRLLKPPVVELLKNPRDLLITLIILIISANIFASSLATSLFIKLFESKKFATFFSIFIMSFIILLFCEIIPITLGVLHSRKLAYKLAFIAKPLLYILKPIVFLFRILTESLIKRINLPAYPHKEDICLEEISQAVDVMVEEGTIKEYEERLIDKLISLKNINIKDIMTPINKLQKINLNEPTINIQIKEIINQGKFSRIPVFKDHRIIGILHIKSLINYLDNPNKFRLEKYLKKPYFVKEDENIAKLLVDLKQKKKHLAVVGSPFEVKGIVTMQDILSQIFGKIKEE